MEKVSRIQKNYSKVGKKNNCHSNQYNPLGSNAILSVCKSKEKTFWN